MAYVEEREAAGREPSVEGANNNSPFLGQNTRVPYLPSSSRASLIATSSVVPKKKTLSNADRYSLGLKLQHSPDGRSSSRICSGTSRSRRSPTLHTRATRRCDPHTSAIVRPEKRPSTEPHVRVEQRAKLERFLRELLERFDAFLADFALR